ncbi:MAG: hypothetical protein V7727_19910 [Sneathiella sp.]
MNCLAKRFLFADNRINFPLQKKEVEGDEIGRLTNLQENYEEVTEAIENAKISCEKLDDEDYRSLSLSRLALERASLDLMYVVSLMGIKEAPGNQYNREIVSNSIARLERVENLLQECSDDRKSDLVEQIEGTVAASLVVQYMIDGSVNSKKLYGETLYSRLHSALNCSDGASNHSYLLLTILYAAGKIISDGPQEVCSEAIAKAIKGPATKHRRLRFDKYLQARVLSMLEKNKLI